MKIIMSNNPFSQVYNGLWQLIDRNTIIQELVRKGNLIKFKEENELKQEINDADTPELQLVTSGGTFGIGGNSTMTQVIKNYTWSIATGSMKVELYNILSFEIFRSLIDYECVLCPLTWCGCLFVTNFRITNIEEGNRMQDLQRSIPGWCALWNCELQMSFPTKNLRLGI